MLSKSAGDITYWRQVREEVVQAIGHIGEYDHQSENITSYMEKLSLFLTILLSGIKKFKEKKKPFQWTK